MLDLISRQAAIDAVYKRIKQIGYEDNSSVLSIRQAIRDLPSAQPERKKGKWVKHVTGHSTYYDCSRCSYIAPRTETANAFLWEMTNYCPNCGARMEGDTDE